VAVAVLALVALVGSGLASPTPARADGAPRAFLLGDSVLLGAAPTIQAEATGHGWAVTVDAKVGRTTAQGAAILRAMRQQLPTVVAIELGNNDGANPASFRNAIDNVMGALVGVRHVVWFTITPFASWVPAANAELQAAVHRWPNLRLADWGPASVQTTGMLYGNGPHLRALGAQRYADLFFATLDDLDRTVPVVGSFSGSAPIFAMGAPEREAATAIASASNGTELWFVTPGGRVFAPTGTPSFGSLESPREPVVGIAATATGKGYWLVASDGGVFSFGDAHFYGSTGAIRLNQPIVGIAATPTGHGYWLVASDGGIFSFGDAHFYGSGVAFHAATAASFIAIASDERGYELAGMTNGAPR
jgi:hypothetical protein